MSNDTAALQNLAVTQTTITWTRGGSSPQFTRVTFESSTDNVNYTPLGNGTAAGSNWTLTGLSLPTGQNIYIRARGYYRSGYYNGSESITESVRNAFVTIPGPQPVFYGYHTVICNSYSGRFNFLHRHYHNYLRHPPSDPFVAVSVNNVTGCVYLWVRTTGRRIRLIHGQSNNYRQFHNAEHKPRNYCPRHLQDQCYLATVTPNC